jgi:hypothetical protein
LINIRFIFLCQEINIRDGSVLMDKFVEKDYKYKKLQTVKFSGTGKSAAVV